MKIYAETKRLILRAVSEKDVAGFFELDSDASVHKYLGGNPIKNIEESRDVIKFIQNQYIENGIGRWSVVEKKSNTFIGWAGLKLIKEEINNHINFYDLGYRIIQKYWGQGFATEAATSCLAYGFANMKLNEVYGMAKVHNFGSNHVLQKIGFKKIESFNFHGKIHNWFKIEVTDRT